MRRAGIAVVLMLAPSAFAFAQDLPETCVWRGHEPRCCDPEWCAEIGEQMGESCRLLDVYSMCATCPGFGCGAGTRGCDTEFCAGVGDSCTDVYPGRCGNCDINADPPCSQVLEDEEEVEIESTCNPDRPRVLLVTDASSSMGINLPGTSMSRMAWAKLAINALFEACPGVDFGLSSFPGRQTHRSHHCNPGRNLVAVGAPRAELIDALNSLSTAGSSPIAATIRALTREVSASSVGRLVVLTDGAETCSGDPAAAVAELLDRGIQTAVVGFDLLSQADRDALNEMAVRGGVPNRFRSTNNAPFFYEATDGDGLVALFRRDLCDLLRQAERCDGSDNDCDGEIDESEDVAYYPPALACRDACDHEVAYVCSGGAWLCQPPVVLGLNQPCEIGVGACRAVGLQQCNGCSAIAGVPREETCNEIDDDCDGETDELPQISCGASQCSRVEVFTDPCSPTCPIPLSCTEVCDGLDEDQDGIVDNVSWAGQCCRAVGQGQVHEGILACGADDKGDVGAVCVTTEGKRFSLPANQAVGADWCDGVDNDCDDSVDEDKLPFERRACYLPGDNTGRGLPFGATGEIICWTTCDGFAVEVCGGGGTASSCGECAGQENLYACDACAPHPGCADTLFGFAFDATCAPRCDGSFRNTCWWSAGAVPGLAAQCQWCGEGAVDETRPYNYGCAGYDDLVTVE